MTGEDARARRMGRALAKPIMLPRRQGAMSFAPLSPSYELRRPRSFDPSGKTPGSPETPSIPRRKNFSLYRNSDLRHYSAILVQEEGRSYVVTNVGGGAVDAVASGTRRRDQGEMNLVRSLLRAERTALKRTAKTCGPDRRCYGQALRRWIGAQPGRGTSPIRKVTEARRNSAPGRARISRQPIAQGRPGVFRPTCCPPVHLRVQILRTADHGCQPAPGLPCALFTERGSRKREKLGRYVPRECRSVRD